MKGYGAKSSIDFAEQARVVLEWKGKQYLSTVCIIQFTTDSYIKC